MCVCVYACVRVRECAYPGAHVCARVCVCARAAGLADYVTMLVCVWLHACVRACVRVHVGPWAGGRRGRWG